MLRNEPVSRKENVTIRNEPVSRKENVMIRNEPVSMMENAECTEQKEMVPTCLKVLQECFSLSLSYNQPGPSSE